MKGIDFRHRHEVMADIIKWWENGYWMTEGTASIKTLSDWAAERFLFLSVTGKPLSYNTIKQEFGEVWRDLQLLKKENKGSKGRVLNKKYPYNN